jgi:hypothetical protein
MQEWKRARLEQLGMSPPDNLTFVPVELKNTQSERPWMLLATNRSSRRSSRGLA